MNTSKKTQTRMFRTIVVMGSSLAVGCGGVAQLNGSSEGAGGSAGSSAKGGSGGVSGSAQGIGGFPGSGGSAISVGGTLAFAGSPTIMPGIGGAGGSAGSPSLPTACPPSQWSCSVADGSGFQCNGYNGSFNPVTCQCDLSRPKSPSDCKPDATYTCLAGDGVAVTAFQCACTSNAAQACADRCMATTHLPDGQGFSCYPNATPNEILCGCAVIVLK